MGFIGKKKAALSKGADPQSPIDEYAQLDAELDKSAVIAAMATGEPVKTAPVPDEVQIADTAPAAPEEPRADEAAVIQEDDAPKPQTVRDEDESAPASDNAPASDDAPAAEGEAEPAQEKAPADPEPAQEEQPAPDPSADKKEKTRRGKNADGEKLTKAERKQQKKEKKQLKKLMKSERKSQKGKGRFITPLILLGIVLTIIIGIVWNIFHCMNHFEINFYQIESVHVTSDVRIAVISDVHLSEYGEDNRDLVEAVRALNPDLIISAGDLVTYGVENYDNMLSLCRQLAEIAPFYGVMGNHEDEKYYLEHDEELRQKFKDTGMIVLVNKCEKIRIRNNDIELIGVRGGTEDYDLYGGRDAMENLGENKTALRICIAHVPTLFKERLEDYDFDIGIAGHTHGGLIRLPMLGGLYSAEEGFRPEYDGGLYRLDNGATLFVSRGLGNSGKIPRFNNTPELAIIDVRWY